MAGVTESEETAASQRFSSYAACNRHFQRLLWLLLLCSLTFVPGCGGCFNSSSNQPLTAEERAEAARKKKEEELKKKKKEKKADFEFGRLTLQPGTRGAPSIFIKPGHWISATQSTKTNNFDFVGELDAAIVDQQGNPINLDETAFRISTARPAALPKGQLKYLDMTFFVPHGMRRARLNSSLRGSYAGSSVNREDSIFNAMPPYQYVMLVLARTPERYGFLHDQQRDFVFVPWNDLSGIDKKLRQYNVISSSAKQKPILLPADSLTWTSMAYLIWDDVDPNDLTKDQQQALLDWLHWGGQLVISGPASLPGLKNSFLSPYLPATSAGSREYTTEDLQDLNNHWTLPRKGKPGYPLRVAKTWSGVELEVHAEAHKVPKSAGLIVERRVGLGRIAVSAIHLSQPEWNSQWPSFNHFFNACVMRRDARKWEPGEYDRRLAWDEGDARPDDPTRVSKVRYFTRDAGSTLNYHILKPTQTITEEEEGLPPQQRYYNNYGYSVDGLPDEDSMSTEDPLAMGGVASWNPFSPASDAARESLRKAAGVEVPEASFVLLVVGAYIFLIVPVNWLVFYVIGRLEWAWIAAPLLAIAYSMLVVRLAQLDIGFVRAETEIAVLELQPGYKRGHLTRYLALYTSLGTQYKMAFEDDTAVALPLPLGKEFQLRPGQSYTTVSYRRFDEATLNDITVSSNSMGMLHAEQMLDLPKPIQLTRTAAGFWTVRNGSEFDLEATAVLRKADHSYHEDPSEQNEMEYAWIGPMKAGELKTLSFTPLTLKSSPRVLRGKNKSPQQADSLDLGRLYALAESASSFEPGEARLVGTYKQVIPGSQVSPAASQLRGATLVVAHLGYGHLPAPKPDANTMEDVNQIKLDILDNENPN